MEIESNDKFTCIDHSASYFFDNSYKFTWCTIFTPKLVADLIVERENYTTSNMDKVVA